MSEYWEYKTIDYQPTTAFNGSVKTEPHESLESLLNEHGRVGWELVSALPNDHEHPRRSLMLILRRPNFDDVYVVATGRR